MSTKQTNGDDKSYEFLNADRKAFTVIKDLPDEDFTIQRREILSKYGKPELNILLTVYMGGLTKTVLKNTKKDDMVEDVVHEELKKIAAMKQKKNGKVGYPVSTGKGRKRGMDEKEIREWFQEIQEFLTKKYSADGNPVKIRLAGGLPAIFSVKVNRRAVAIKPLKNYDREIQMSTRVDKGTQHNAVIHLDEKEFDKYFADAIKLQGDLTPAPKPEPKKKAEPKKAPAKKSAPKKAAKK